MFDPRKQKIIQLVAVWRERSGLSIEQVLARLQTYGCPISRSQFENRFTTRAETLIDIQPDLTLALIKAFRQDLTPLEQCTLAEAQAFATLTRLPHDQFRDLDRLFLSGERYDFKTAHQPKPIHLTHPRQYWGDAPDVAHFQGRPEQLRTLEQWIINEGCRLVGILGLGGVGKTVLVTKLAERIQDHFDYLLWLSLRNAPPLTDTLDECLQLLSPQQDDQPLNHQNVAQKMKNLLHGLRRHRCLLIFDNAEIILSDQTPAGHDQSTAETYGQLFQRLGEVRHQSCLVLTSREKPKEFVYLEGGSVRILELDGLQVPAVRALLSHKALTGDHIAWQQLIVRYSGNPLALKLAAETICDLFGGDIQDFLQRGETIFGNIRSELDQQFDRLSPLEQGLMFWLAIERESVSPAVLNADILSPLWKQGLQEALLSLRRRSLLEQSGAQITLQNVIMEYVTHRLVDQICTEIEDQTCQGLHDYALLKAQAKEHIRHTQRRLILEPIVSRLLAKFRQPEQVAQTLLQALSALRGAGHCQPSYAAGNILNLLRQFNYDLSGCDFSNLTVWQADLQDISLHEVNFAGADLSRSIFTQAFGIIIAASVSPNGDLLAAAAGDNLYVWSLADYQLRQICQGHQDWITALAFDPQGQILASGSDDWTIKLWHLNSGASLKTLAGHTHSVKALAFSPDGQTLISGSSDQTIRVWNVQLGSCKEFLREGRGWIWAMALHPSGAILASGGDDSKVRLYHLESGQVYQTCQGHQARIWAIAFNPDGQTLVSGSDDQTIRVWDVQTGQCRQVLQGHRQWVRTLAFSPDGQILASGSEDRSIKLWDLRLGQCIRTLTGHDNLVRSLTFRRNSSELVSASEDQTIKLWDVQKGYCLKTLKGHGNWIWSVNFHPEGKLLASGGNDHGVRLWDISTEQPVRVLKGHLSWVWCVVFSPDGHLVASGSNDNTIRLWEVRTGRCLKTLAGHEKWVRSLDFSPDGRILVSGSNDNTIKLWTVRTGACLKTLDGHTGWITSVAFSPTASTLIASSSEDQSIKVWDTQTGHCHHTLSDHSHAVTYVTFSPDGQVLASCGFDQVIRLWDVHTGRCLKILPNQAKPYLSLAFQVGGQLLASGSDDHSIDLWNLQTGQCLGTLLGHQSWVCSLAFNPETLLASGSYDGTIKLWDVQTGQCLRTLRSKRPYEGLNISRARGLPEIQKTSLKLLGAIEDST